MMVYKGFVAQISDGPDRAHKRLARKSRIGRRSANMREIRSMPAAPSPTSLSRQPTTLPRPTARILRGRRTIFTDVELRLPRPGDDPGVLQCQGLRSAHCSLLRSAGRRGRTLPGARRPRRDRMPRPRSASASLGAAEGPPSWRVVDNRRTKYGSGLPERRNVTHPVAFSAAHIPASSAAEHLAGVRMPSPRPIRLPPNDARSPTRVRRPRRG